MNDQASNLAEAERKPEARQQHCPICDRKVIESARYPSYVCKACSARATDSLGRKVKLSNGSLSGGFIAKYEDGSAADEVQASQRVFIDGMAFHASEAYMGGVVITPLVK